MIRSLKDKINIQRLTLHQQEEELRNTLRIKAEVENKLGQLRKLNLEKMRERMER